MVVLHLAGRYPLGGIGWQAIHYVLGLTRLGHDVHYVEDSGAYPYDPRVKSVVEDPSYSVAFLADVMGRFGLADRWTYVDAVTGVHHGLSRERLADLYRDADAIFNVCGATRLTEEHLRCPIRVYVETDPARTLKVEERWAKWGLGVPLVVLTSPYRSILRPLMEYIDQIQSRGDDQMVTIVLPEFLPRRWWQHVLHNQTALLVKGALLFHKNIVVADVPYLLKR